MLSIQQAIEQIQEHILPIMKTWPDYTDDFGLTTAVNNAIQEINTNKQDFDDMMAFTWQAYGFALASTKTWTGETIMEYNVEAIEMLSQSLVRMAQAPKF